MKKSIYLCGGINKLSDSDAKDWREAAKQVLGSNFELVDPMVRDYRGREAECYREIINGDMEDIGRCEIILVNAIRPSWGTAMEVYASSLRGPFQGFDRPGRLIVTVCPEDRPSPWLVGHSTYIVKTFESAFKVLLRYAEEGK